jgi:hypothetical protein
VPVIDCVVGTYVDRGHFNATYANLSLTNAGLEFASKAYAGLALPYQNLTWADLNMFYLMFNGDGSLRDAMNTSMMLADQRSATQADAIDTANLAVLLVALGVALVLAVGIVTPAVFSVLEDKHVVFDAYLGVPIKIVRRLRTRVFNRIDSLRREEQEQDENMMDDQLLDKDDLDEIERENGAVGDHDGSDHGDVGRRKDKGDNGSVGTRSLASSISRWTKVSNMPADAVRVNMGAKRNARKYRNSSNAAWRLLFILFTPLAAYMGYFGGMYYWRADAVHTSRYARSEVLWSKQIEFFLSVSPNALDYVCYVYRCLSFCALALVCARANPMLSIVTCLEIAGDEFRDAFDWYHLRQHSSAHEKHQWHVAGRSVCRNHSGRASPWRRVTYVPASDESLTRDRSTIHNQRLRRQQRYIIQRVDL